jgi:hypothetical protein
MLRDDNRGKFTLLTNFKFESNNNLRNNNDIHNNTHMKLTQAINGASISINTGHSLTQGKFIINAGILSTNKRTLLDTNILDGTLSVKRSSLNNVLTDDGRKRNIFNNKENKSKSVLKSKLKHNRSFNICRI